MRNNKLMLFLLSVVFVLSISCQSSYGLFIPPDQPQKSAFGENLVGQLSPQYQGSFEYTVDNTDLNTNVVEESGTVTQGNAMAILTTTTTTASTAMLQSVPHAKYRSGLGGLARYTALFADPVTGTEQYIGIMDQVGSSVAFENGYSFGYTSTSFGIQRWSNDTLSVIAQSDWNVDTLGAGTKNPSGMTLVHTKLNVFQIRYQFLGAGAISYYVEDDSTGMFTLVHMIKYANNFIEPSVFNPNFHHTMWVNNGSTASNIILKSSSYAYFIEGRTSFIELHQPTNTSGIQTKATITTEVAIFTIRNKATYVSKTNFIDINLSVITADIEASAANNLGSIRVVKNATLGGTPSFSDISTSNSVIEIDTSGTTVTGGKELAAGLLAGKNADVRIDFVNDRILLHPGETLTISGISVNSATINALIRWRELF